MEFTYRKVEDISLKGTWNTMNLYEAQSYNPIFNTFFALNETNFYKMTLNQKNHLEIINKKLGSNIYECSVNGTTKDVFFKEAPLLDTVRYLTGKYDLFDPLIYKLPTISGVSHSKLDDPNNASYVDGFFAYLSSELLHNHYFFHGLDFYGSFLGIKHDYTINIGEDIDILCDSNFFHQENGKHFFLETGIELCGDTRKNRPPISISPTERFTEQIVNSEQLEPIQLTKYGELELVFESSSKVNEEEAYSEIGSDSDGDSGSETEDDTSSENQGEDEEVLSEINDTNDIVNEISSECSSEEDNVHVTIPKFPIQAIALEKCEETLDHFLLHNDVSDEELGSMVFQIVMALIVYQKAFDFTHNDLHTSNIMYKTTDKTYLCYKYEGRYYKVPTFGRIYKIIDFGRAIYKFRGKRLCSDSYHPEGDAATQYNCEPYYNEFKPVIEPNPSFDLCRLGCALFDLLVDDMDKLNEESEVVQLIVDWCYDDKGRNILYKKSGAERYPEFKLYKMIARTVHRCVPHEVFRNIFFEQYIVSKKKVKQQKCLNVDEIPDYREKL